MSAWYEEMIADVSAAFNERDFARAKRWLHPDAIWDFTRSIGLEAGSYRGAAAWEQFFDRFIDPWEEVNWEAIEVEELGRDRLLVTARMRGRGRGSGVEVNASGAQIWELRDRKLVRLTFFQSRDEAAAELEP